MMVTYFLTQFVRYFLIRGLLSHSGHTNAWR